MTRATGKGKPSDVVGVVLAAGEGKRTKFPLPKVLQPVCGRPMVSWVIDALRRGGIGRIVVVIGNGHTQVKKALEKEGVETVLQKERLGTGHAVERVRSRLKGFSGPVLIASGDTPLIRQETVRSLVSFYRREKGAGVLATFEPPDPTGYGRVLKNVAGNILRIIEEKEAGEAEKVVPLVNGGLYVFSAPDLFRALRKVGRDNRAGEYYLPDVIPALADEEKRVGGLEFESWEELHGVNTLSDLAEASRVLRFRLMEHWMGHGVRIVDPATTYIESDVKIAPGTVIHPFTYIQGGVKIGPDCEVGPFTHLRRGTVLEKGAEIGNFTEVKASRVGRGSKAKHLSYLGDAAIGADVNIGAGTIVANYDGKEKHRTTIRDGAFIGSGTVLVAPVKVGKKGLTGAGAVVTRGHDVKDEQVVVGVPARPLEKTDHGRSKTRKKKSSGGKNG